MVNLVEAEADRLLGETHALEMASCLDPPDLPWKENKWAKGPVGVHAAMGRGPKVDKGVVIDHVYPNGHRVWKACVGVKGQADRVTLRLQTARDQWVPKAVPSLRPFNRIPRLPALDQLNLWARCLRARVKGSTTWKYEHPRQGLPSSVTVPMAHWVHEKMWNATITMQDRLRDYTSAMARVVQQSVRVNRTSWGECDS
jgi:hypothetical protein